MREHASSSTCRKKPPLSTTKTKPIRLLLVDDHEVVRIGLRTVCTASLNLWTDRFSLVAILSVKNSAASEAPLLKGNLVALACYSVTRSTIVSHPNHFEQIALCFRHLP